MTNQVPLITPSIFPAKDPEFASTGSADIVVLGIGNLLLGDDGAGIHVIERLGCAGRLPADVRLVDGGTIGFTLLEQVEAARVLIIVDAMRQDAPPGTVSVHVDEDLDEFLAAPLQRSVHDANVGDVLRMSALRGRLPAHRVLVGIAPLSIGWGDTPSPEVAGGIDKACDRIAEMIEEWRQ